MLVCRLGRRDLHTNSNCNGPLTSEEWSPLYESWRALSLIDCNCDAVMTLREPIFAAFFTVSESTDGKDAYAGSIKQNQSFLAFAVTPYCMPERMPRQTTRCGPPQ
jgi:hypothetical protein